MHCSSDHPPKINDKKKKNPCNVVAKNKAPGSSLCLCAHVGPISFLTGYNLSPEGGKPLLQNYPGKEYYITSRIMSMKRGPFKGT